MSTTESDKFYLSVNQVSQKSWKRNNDNKSREPHDTKYQTTQRPSFDQNRELRVNLDSRILQHWFSKHNRTKSAEGRVRADLLDQDIYGTELDMSEGLYRPGGEMDR